MDTKKTYHVDRRQFLRCTCGAGLAAAAGAAGLDKAWGAGDASDAAVMPQRPLGKTGVNVPILALGGSLNLMNRQLLLAQALKMGVTYWDTANNYSGGRSEDGIGAYFAKHPEDRKRVFLVTKTSAGSPENIERSLAESLRRLKTDYVDLYLFHGLSRVEGEIDARILRWVEKVKAEGRIRFFGFSTHRNMAACLTEAARIGGVDAIMMTYNYRVMGGDDMQQAVADCVRAGIGLVAMKSQGRAFSFADSEKGDQLVQHFQDRGMSKHQARLKAVWENPHIASICSHMDTLAILKENVDAARDRMVLSEQDRDLLQAHAQRTATDYCAGCGDICESGLDISLPVADVMRCLMYAYCYNDYQMARDAMAQLPPGIRQHLLATDFSEAEKRCPKGMAIGRFMRLAAAAMEPHHQA